MSTSRTVSMTDWIIEHDLVAHYGVIGGKEKFRALARGWDEQRRVAGRANPRTPATVARTQTTPAASSRPPADGKWWLQTRPSPAHRPVRGVLRSAASAITVRVSRRALDVIHAEAQRCAALGVETGGLLVGHAAWGWDRDLDVTEARVAVVGGSREADGVKLHPGSFKSIDMIVMRDSGGLRGLRVNGCWHSHPRAAGPSSEDITAFARTHAQASRRAHLPTMAHLIIYPDSDRGWLRAAVAAYITAAAAGDDTTYTVQPAKVA
jgi:proteasome lid subunit RPN8/RPN11